MRTGTSAACFFLILLLMVSPAPGGDNATRGEMVQETFVQTEHRLKLPGRDMRYTATAGKFVLKDAQQKKAAAIFFIAYERTDDGRAADRPVTFAFNGGPGSSSVWLHFGALGPHRVRLGEKGRPEAPPASIIPNEHTWLAFTDLVFIDPVGTGFSRAAEPEKQKKFYDVKKDIASVADFIRCYLTRYERWLSPRFLAGESYGTTRAVGMAEHLHDQFGIDVNGLVLISPVLDFMTLRFDRSGDLPYMLYVPAYAAAAHYHGKAGSGAGLEEFLSQAEDWAIDTYCAALARGSAVSGDRKKAVAETLAGFAGVSADYVLKNDLRVPPHRLRKELLRDSGRVIGRMDARLTGYEADRAASASSTDPSLDMFIGPFAAAANHYVRTRLGFESHLPYIHLNDDAARTWNWQSAIHGGQGFLNVSGSLKNTLQFNPHLGVFIAAGYYDLATPYFATRYTVSHLGLPGPLHKNISCRFYDAGHMMYIDGDQRAGLSSDARRFYTRLLNRDGALD